MIKKGYVFLHIPFLFYFLAKILIFMYIGHYEICFKRGTQLSTMQTFRITTLLFFIIMLDSAVNDIFSQNTELKKYDVFSDTLLIINDKTIDCERVLMNRKELFEADTFKINQKGLQIASFTMTAFALGYSIELFSSDPILTQAMRNEIINKQANFKFIYIKDINLQAKDGRIINPSINTIKIIFSN